MRARNIKPGLFDNELLGEAGSDVTLTFIGLWMMADREGRLEDRPARIRKGLFGYAESPPDVVQVLDTLVGLGFIRRYTVGGLALIEVANFAKHQNPHRNEKPSELPAPSESEVECGSQHDSRNYPSVSDHAEERPDALGLNPDSLTPDPGLLNDESGKRNHDVPGVGPSATTLKANAGVDHIAHLITAHGWSELRLHTERGRAAQVEAWTEDGVTLAELDAAVTKAARALAKKGDTRQPPLGYLATIIANERQSGPVRAAAASAGNHTGFANRDYENDPWLSRFADRAEAAS